jgi:hypothetical protein
MIARTHVEGSLRTLDRLFREATSAKHALFYSKLAILELCGWIEESMDDVVLRCAVRHLRRSDNRRYVEKQIVKRTYGFDYDRHFREMLIRLLGLVAVERIENAVDPAKSAMMRSTLATLTVVRNTEAHTHVKGVTTVINAPSVTRTHFVAAFEGLSEYDRVIRSKSVKLQARRRS